MKVWRIALQEALGPPMVALVTEDAEGRIYLAHCNANTPGACRLRPDQVHPLVDFPRLAQEWLDRVKATPGSVGKFPIDDVPPSAKRHADAGMGDPRADSPPRIPAWMEAAVTRLGESEVRRRLTESLRTPNPSLKGGGGGASTPSTASAAK